MKKIRNQTQINHHESSIAQDGIRVKYIIPNLLTAFESFYDRLPWMGKADGIDKRPSMEQLWLAFYMKEKHGKVWSGTEWI